MARSARAAYRVRDQRALSAHGSGRRNPFPGHAKQPRGRALIRVNPKIFARSLAKMRKCATTAHRLYVARKKLFSDFRSRNGRRKLPSPRKAFRRHPHVLHSSHFSALRRQLVNITHKPATARLTLVGLLFTAALTACGGGSDETVAAAPPPGPSAPAPSPAPAPAAPLLPAVADNIAINPVAACTMADIGSTALTADKPVTILSVSTGTTTGSINKPYCLVKLKVDPAVNIWVALPSASWNGRFRAEGNGVYAGGTPAIAQDSVKQDFVGVTTDTGHSTSALSGAFGMSSPGVANTQLQVDFAYRSEHLMAEVGKQVVKAFYKTDPVRSYWYGCSTGGRQGLMMAQRYPADYDAILAGDPAIHWDQFQAYQIWPHVVMKAEGATALSSAKRTLLNGRVMAACDGLDGVTDNIIDDPRKCSYDPRVDTTITKAGCADDTCLSPAEANSVQRIWGGARNAAGDLLWPGLERGSDLSALAGAAPFPIPIEQARYWVYLDPTWDWNTLTPLNYETFHKDNIRMVGPVIGTDNPDISAFKARGGKVIMYHGWADQLIMPGGSVKYFEKVKATVPNTDEFARLYMVPGMGHCSGGTGPDSFGQGSSGAVPMTPERDVFRALMAWSEKDVAPTKIVAAKISGGITTRTRPLCPYPQVARFKGTGSSDDASSFSCVAP
ncbi:MAG: tannase/feruloyl esterase family alpha/beta hydrolase [Comamonadaceae bacterium]|nr:MAG: tannase/feruloyl esterase family alpha/beta hydrolase [Comamonadaceae bacterium]